MSILSRLFKSKEAKRQAEEEIKATPHRSKEVQGLLILTQRSLTQDSFGALIRQILQSEIASGYTVPSSVATSFEVNPNFNDGAYIYKKIRASFPKLGDQDIKERIKDGPLDFSDGSSGVYLVVYDK